MTEIDESAVDRAGRPAAAGPGDATSAADEELRSPGQTRQPAKGSFVPGSGGAVPPPSKLTRRGRIRKWDRPPPPHDWRWAAGLLGKALITIGLLMFGFVAYQLWGTGIETARAQRALESDFGELIAAAPPIDVERAIITGGREAIDDTAPGTDTADSTDGAADSDDADSTDGAADSDDGGQTGVDPAPAVAVLPADAQNIPEVEHGDAVARIEIPAIGVDEIVVAGVGKNDLKKGPGHYPDTPLPGQLGNAAIAGHRTTYGNPFFDVDRLGTGDEIRVTTLTGTYVYRVTGQQIVLPSAGEVVATTDPTQATLTLTSCHPKWTARERIVISSELDADESSIIGEPVINYGQAVAAYAPGDDLGEDAPTGGSAEPAEPATSGGVSGTLVERSTVGIGALGTAAANEGVADAFAEGWFSDPAANLHVLFWGAMLAMVGIGAYLLSRVLRRDWVGALVGLLPFFVVLYFFFQNVIRLLPPNL